MARRRRRNLEGWQVQEGVLMSRDGRSFYCWWHENAFPGVKLSYCGRRDCPWCLVREAGRVLRARVDCQERRRV